jgi:hypothetical protein
VVAEAANAIVSILRGVTYDDYGNLTDAGTEVFSSIPAILVETSHSTFDPAAQKPRTIRMRLPAWTEALNSDQIRNQVTGDLFAVTDVTRPPTLTAMPVGGLPDLVLTLKRVTGAGT